MKDYVINLDLDINPTNKNIELLIERSYRLGLKFYADEVEISYKEVICVLTHVAEKQQTVKTFFNNTFFWFTRGSDYFEFYSIDHSYLWKRNFKYKYNPDNVNVLRLFLNLSEGFPIKQVSVGSDLQHFFNLKLNNSFDFYDPAQKNAFHTFVLFGADESDAWDLILSAYAHEYDFFIEPNSVNILNMIEATDVFIPAIVHGETKQLYVQVEDTLSILRISHKDIMSLIPLEPYRTRQFEQGVAIDRAFYLAIVLNLIEEFGFDEMTCNF